MPKRHNSLFHGIANFRSLRRSALKAAKGKRGKPGAAAFLADLEGECLRLESELEDGSYRPGAYIKIEVWEPKHRVVSAAPFRDRVVHHALCAIVLPIFEAGFISGTFANRTGKGTHRAVQLYERYRDRSAQVLRCDVFRYFPAIDHEVLKRDFRRRLACAQTLALLDLIVDGSNAQEPVNLYFGGDDLFAPFARRRGLPIGNLTSQFFANIHLDRFDHFVKQELRVPGYVRYVDDFILFGPDRATLHRWGRQCREYLEARRMEIHPDKYRLCRTAEGVDFCGFVVRADGRVKLRSSGVRRFRRRYLKLRHEWKAGRVEAADVRDAVCSWIAHASHAQTWRLRGKVLAP